MMKRSDIGDACIAAPVLAAVAWLLLNSGCADSPVSPAAKPAAPVFASEWGGKGDAPGQFEFPLGIAVDSKGLVYVTDLRNDRIQKFDSSGNFLDQWTLDTEEFRPAAIALDGDDRIYVTDLGSHKVRLFDSRGSQVLSWGGEGQELGKFRMPMAIAVGADGVFVADRNNYRIQRFTRDGEFQLAWDAGREQNGGRYWGPHGLALEPGGTLLMIEWHGYQVYRFSTAGELLGTWGDFGATDGKTSNVYGIAVDGRGRVLVSDLGLPSIVEYSEPGRFSSRWGRRGQDTGQFDLPWGIGLGPSGEVYVADSNRNMILKFSRG